MNMPAAVSEFRLCIIIPCYNHGRELAAFLPAVAAHGLPIIIADDGSRQEEAAIAEEAAAACGAAFLRGKENQGKWGAIRRAIAYAIAQGYTHALQCDADGQHDATVIPQFCHLAQQNPEALICGSPLYGEDIPKARLKGRGISNFFTRLETAWACKLDTMCGFRLYPLQHLTDILCNKNIMPGMPGDIEILVHFYWRGCRVIPQPVRVCYPEGGRSNFRMLRDNVLISWAHTKLCTAALLHPWRLWRAHRPR